MKQNYKDYLSQTIILSFQQYQDLLNEISMANNTPMIDVSTEWDGLDYSFRDEEDETKEEFYNLLDETSIVTAISEYLEVEISYISLDSCECSPCVFLVLK